ncbi:rRNA-processing protein utp23 [Seiridium cupressi]|uniref:rRNA-processing protein utp23 n=1 Tax=Seiridium unicorne TaxID=138068 RepID=A0ABR2VBR0_9PEZI
MPRAKTAKRYRKLMEKYSLTFGFREPYQILVDADLLADACRFKMDLIKSFEQTLSGKVKLLITQCSMRHLYNTKSEPGVYAAIEFGKTLERRRCGHHPDEYPEPLSTLECLSSVVDPKDNGFNKHRYVVASNDQSTRQTLRSVKGTPLIYISRSVMIMEPMADESVQVRNKEERAKLRAEIKRFQDGKKRKRDDDSDGDAENGNKNVGGTPAEAGDVEAGEKKKKKQKGPKGPNPLAVKKKKSTTMEGSKKSTEETPAEPAPKDGPKRKRRKKNKSEAGGEDGESTAQADTEIHEVEADGSD